MPGWKLLAAAGGGIMVASYAGPKIGAKLVGPEMGTMDIVLNNVKVYGSTLGVGLVTFVVLHTVLRA